METDLTKILIEDFGLSPHTKCCLEAVDIHSVGQLMGYTKLQLFELLRAKRLGFAYLEMVNEIRKILGGQGLFLKDDRPDLSKIAQGRTTTDTFLEVGKEYGFEVGRMLYKGTIKDIRGNEILITDASVVVLDENYGSLDDYSPFKVEIILLKNTLDRIGIKK
jgi:hypothetical protein